MTTKEKPVMESAKKLIHAAQSHKCDNKNGNGRLEKAMKDELGVGFQAIVTSDKAEFLLDEGQPPFEDEPTLDAAKLKCLNSYLKRVEDGEFDGGTKAKQTPKPKTKAKTKTTTQPPAEEVYDPMADLEQAKEEDAKEEESEPEPEPEQEQRLEEGGVAKHEEKVPHGTLLLDSALRKIVREEVREEIKSMDWSEAGMSEAQVEKVVNKVFLSKFGGGGS